MEVQVDGETIFAIEPWKLILLQDDLPSASLNAEIQRRLAWVIDEKLKACYQNMYSRWLPILQADPNVTGIPKTPQDFVNYVTSRPDYQNRDQRDNL